MRVPCRKVQSLRVENFRLGFRVSRAFGLELCKYRSHAAEKEIGRRLHGRRRQRMAKGRLVMRTGAKSCSLPFVLQAIADARLDRSMLSEEQLVAAETAPDLTPQSIEHTTVARPRRNVQWLREGFEEATLMCTTKCSLRRLHNHGGKDKREQRWLTGVLSAQETDPTHQPLCRRCGVRIEFQRLVMDAQLGRVLAAVQQKKQSRQFHVGEKTGCNSHIHRLFRVLLGSDECLASGSYKPSTYGHSQLKTGHPVRSAIHKQLNGRLVLRWVTTWESLLL
ncbi:hypothetical protein KCU81_g879, partial [Aureobasidium melanogenum]